MTRSSLRGYETFGGERKAVLLLLQFETVTLSQVHRFCFPIRSAVPLRRGVDKPDGLMCRGVMRRLTPG